METESVGAPELSGNIVQVSHTIQSEYSGQRLDHYLVLQYPQLSRSQLTHSIKKGFIHINGAMAKASRKLHVGDEVYGHIQIAEELSVKPQKVEFEILFEDEYLLIISKPPHLVVHPASGNHENTLVNGLLYHCRRLVNVGDPIRPGIVHRLDKDTSGVMVVAKDNVVHRTLVEAFKSRTIQKKYCAIVRGIVPQTEGRIVAPLGRHPVNRKKMAIREKDGKYSVSNWKLVKELAGKFSLVEIGIETGRTHQIRVHMASIGHPVAGDVVYGPSKIDPLFKRQMLHSSMLRFAHPVTGKMMIGKAPLWQDFADTINLLDSYREEP